MRTADETMPDALIALRASLTERLAALRGVPRRRAAAGAARRHASQRVRVPGGDVFLVRPADWEQLRHEEGGAGRPVPVLGDAMAERRGARRRARAKTRRRRARACSSSAAGSALPSIVAARAGADVLATDGAADAVAFAAHSLALNELEGEVAQVDWSEQGDALAARGPWDLVLAADVLYLKRERRGSRCALVPRLLAPGGEVRLADPRRAGARDFLAAARATFTSSTRQEARWQCTAAPNRRGRAAGARCGGAPAAGSSRGASPSPGR